MCEGRDVGVVVKKGGGVGLHTVVEEEATNLDIFLGVCRPVIISPDINLHITQTSVTISGIYISNQIRITVCSKIRDSIDIV